MGKKAKIQTNDTAVLQHNPFAALAAALPSTAAEVSAPLPQKTPETPTILRVVLRLERKGRGGKEVTLAELRAGSVLSTEEMERFLRECKQSLGCGGIVEGNSLVLQGDQRERLQVFFEKRGIRAS